MSNPKQSLGDLLKSYSPFFISDLCEKLIPGSKKGEKKFDKMYKNIYMHLKYYHPSNWVSKKVNQGKAGRPRLVWSYVE